MNTEERCWLCKGRFDKYNRSVPFLDRHGKEQPAHKHCSERAKQMREGRQKYLPDTYGNKTKVARSLRRLTPKNS